VINLQLQVLKSVYLTVYISQYFSLCYVMSYSEDFFLFFFPPQNSEFIFFNCQFISYNSEKKKKSELRDVNSLIARKKIRIVRQKVAFLAYPVA